MKRPLVIAALIAVAIVLYLILGPILRDRAIERQNRELATGDEAAQPRSSTPTKAPANPPAERSTLADGLNTPNSDIRTDLRIVAEVVDTFRTNFPQEGNPVGSNAEITAVLTGRNKLRLALIPRDHLAINKNGELCDRWGTPFFFHALSATKMEIRSAGPDKKMWSDDDVVYTP